MKRIIEAAAAVLLLAGCSGQSEPTMTVGTPAPTTQSPTPSPAPTGLVGKIGDTYTSSKVDVTLEEFNPNVTTTASDETWQAALVKTCAKSDGITVSTWPWQAIGANSGRYRQASSHYGDAPKPLYPIVGEPVLNGECVRGWILFDSPASIKVTEVRYSPQGEAPARWIL